MHCPCRGAFALARALIAASVSPRGALDGVWILSGVARAFLGALALAAATGTGCAAVDPWQRERLADPIMIFDHDAMEADAREHLLRAREGSAGAAGGGGGGCGCEQ